MSTDAVLEANRRNSLLSTGPKTDEGKQACSQNSIRHGLLSNVIPKDIPEFNELIEGLYQSLNPQDGSQRFLVNQIAVCMLRITIIQSHDLDFFAEIAELGREEKNQRINEHLQSKATQLAHRYETAHNRQIEKNLKKLKELKSESAMQTDQTDSPSLPESIETAESMPNSAFSIPPSAFRSASFRNCAFEVPSEPESDLVPDSPPAPSGEGSQRIRRLIKPNRRRR